MKNKIMKFASFCLAIGLTLVLYSCPPPGNDGPVTPPPVNLVFNGCGNDPYMSIPENQILNVSHQMEYSLNNGGAWTDCGGGVVSVTFTAGNQV